MDKHEENDWKGNHWFPLRAILESKGVSQSELARRTGMKPTYISRLVRQQTNPRWNTVIMIALALQLDLGDFYAGQDSR